ncbi:hypothetical protein H0H92_006674, partial [Tricholoma furcatifolium]
IPGPGSNYSPGTVTASDHETVLSQPLASSAPLISSSAVSDPDPEVAAEQAPTEHVPPEQRCHNVAHNIQGIPKGAQQRCVSERSAWEAFKQALDAERVVRVTISVQETRLSRQDFDL